MAARLIIVAERVLKSLEQKGSLNQGSLHDLLEEGESEALLDQALWFLAGRDEILVDLATHAVHLRTFVSRRIMSALNDDGLLSIAEIAERTRLSVATCCDVLGWLEREGRVSIDPQDRVASLDSRPRG